MNKKWLASLVLVGMLLLALAPATGPHSADVNGDWKISLSELLRVIQFFNTHGYAIASAGTDTEDGYVPLGQQAEGEGEPEPLSVTITSPADGAVFTLDDTRTPPLVGVPVAVSIGGSPDLGPIEVTLVSSEGKGDDKAYHQIVTAPATVSYPFILTLKGEGSMSAQAKVVETGVTVTQSKSIFIQ